MDHVVYVDAKAKEMEQLLGGSKRMILRGATGRKLPYGRVFPGDQLYFIRNNAEAQVMARARVSEVFNLGPLTPEESQRALDEHQVELQLTPAQVQRWAGKRYLVLIRLEAVEEQNGFEIDRSAYGSMDDWLPVGEIDHVKVH
ncbi:MAG: hypothetical protein HY835_08385 [Anaerolineae bacterium]|nr:hypothetical protein [Anaerolineae bacterium]